MFYPPEFADETCPTGRDRGTRGAVTHPRRPNGAKHRSLLVSPLLRSQVLLLKRGGGAAARPASQRGPLTYGKIHSGDPRFGTELASKRADPRHNPTQPGAGRATEPPHAPQGPAQTPRGEKQPGGRRGARLKPCCGVQGTPQSWVGGRARALPGTGTGSEGHPGGWEWGDGVTGCPHVWGAVR